MFGSIGVFSNWNPSKAGDVLQQAHPAVGNIPFIPNQTSVRTSPTATERGPGQVAGSTVQRVQPQEKGTYFTRRSLGPSASSPAREGCPGGCGGCQGGKDNSRAGER
jgi:hypothetical protein